MTCNLSREDARIVARIIFGAQQRRLAREARSATEAETAADVAPATSADDRETR